MVGHTAPIAATQSSRRARGSAAPVTSALDHIEKTLAAAYRREIEQGENVWRSLPVFAATIAF